MTILGCFATSEPGFALVERVIDSRQLPWFGNQDLLVNGVMTFNYPLVLKTHQIEKKIMQ